MKALLQIALFVASTAALAQDPNYLNIGKPQFSEAEAANQLRQAIDSQRDNADEAANDHLDFTLELNKLGAKKNIFTNIENLKNDCFLCGVLTKELQEDDSYIDFVAEHTLRGQKIGIALVPKQFNDDGVLVDYVILYVKNSELETALKRIK